MKLLAPSTPSVRIPKVRSAARAIKVTVETLTRRVKVRLLVVMKEWLEMMAARARIESVVYFAGFICNFPELNYILFDVLKTFHPIKVQ